MTTRATLATLALLLCVTGGAKAETTVRFVSPERYGDVDTGGLDGAGILPELGRHIERLGDRYMPRGDRLLVEVLDLDRAGRSEPWRGPGLGQVRIQRDTTPPRIRLRTTYRRGGARPIVREETLTDSVYQLDASARLSGDRLAFEKALLDRWFRARFGDRQ